MLKQLVIISGILIMSGCTSISERGHCDPNLNYVKSNIPAMKEYSQLKKEGKIKSIYYEYLGEKNCHGNDCIKYNASEYDFYETNHNYNNTNGIYTLKYNKKENCENISNCLTITKNNKILSKYKLTLDTSQTRRIIISLTDIKNNIELYEKSYQVYSTGGLGGPAGTYCSESYIQNPNYKFDPGSFSDDGILTKIKGEI